jgi:GNAT superfamily N-acetyltransferase
MGGGPEGGLGMAREWRRGAYLMTTDKARLDLAVIHGFLKTSYWAGGIPAETVRRSVENSLTFGLFAEGEQVGFARVVTDCATFAYLADVFVLETHRGRGLGKWMMEVVTSHPDLQGLRRWMLATRDAHDLYREHGFAELEEPQIFMEKYSPYE